MKMNKRIEQLVEMSWEQKPAMRVNAETFEAEPLVYLGKQIYRKEFNQEKFAELILQDCLRICDEVQARYGQYTFTARVCKEEIQQLFEIKQ